MRTVTCTAALLLIVVCVSSAWSQAATSSSTATLSPSAVPEPYTKDEFPPWAVGLRRFEIVSLGAFPILLFYTRVGMDLKRYVENGFESVYAPWPFKNENSYKAGDDEQLLSVATAAGLSLVFGAIDALFLWKATID